MLCPGCHCQIRDLPCHTWAKTAQAHLQFTFPGSHRGPSATNDVIFLTVRPVANASSCLVGSTPARSRLRAPCRSPHSYFSNPQGLQAPLCLHLGLFCFSAWTTFFSQSLHGLVLIRQVLSLTVSSWRRRTSDIPAAMSAHAGQPPLASFDLFKPHSYVCDCS